MYKKVYSDILKAQNRLKRTKICEDFGQKEVSKLKYKYDYLSLIYGTEEERRTARLIDNFNEWCMSYC